MQGKGSLTSKEIWKEYPLNFDFIADYRVEVSNHGRVRTFNKAAPEGRLLKGSVQQGYPIVRLKFMRPRTATVEATISEFNQELRLISEQIKTTRKSDFGADKIFALVEKLKAEKLLIIAKRSKYIKKTDKKRAVHQHFLIHRAVAELFLDKPEGADFVIHKDFQKENNHVSNLEWMSKEEAFSRFSELPQYKDKSVKQRKKMRKRGSSKLQIKDVLYIKEKLAQGKTLRSLALRFQVSDMQIHRIKTGENWSEVKTVRELRSGDRK